MSNAPWIAQEPVQSAAANFTDILVRELKKLPNFAHVQSLSVDSEVDPQAPASWTEGVARLTATTANGSFTVECVSGAVVGLKTTVTVPQPHTGTVKEYRFGGVEPIPSTRVNVLHTLERLLTILSTQPFRSDYVGVMLPPRPFKVE